MRLELNRDERQTMMTLVVLFFSRGGAKRVSVEAHWTVDNEQMQWQHPWQTSSWSLALKYESRISVSLQNTEDDTAVNSCPLNL